jgi:hypothetical protein
MPLSTAKCNDSVRMVGNPYRGIMSGLPVTQRNLFQDGCDGPGGFDPSHQTERHHERDGNEARCPKNAGMAHCLPAASTKWPPIDGGATTRRFPAADAA